MRNTIRFTLSERERRKIALKRLNDPVSTREQKRAAQQVIDELFKSAEARLNARIAKKAVGPPPDRNNYETYEDFFTAQRLYWHELDKIQAAKVLSDPEASFTQRERARRRLEAILQVLPGGRLINNRQVSPVRRYNREPGEKERAARFLDELQKEAAND